MALSCTVLGGGSWGTALACQLARRGHDTVMWDRSPVRCDAINRDHMNPRYLKGVALPPNLRASPDIEASTAHGQLIVAVVPSHALREVLVQAAPHLRADAQICIATKGIEEGSLLTMHSVVRECVPTELHRGVTVLSGPSFALEVARGLPTAVTIAGDKEPATLAAEAFHGEAFRAYHTEDVVGVCVGGSVKNVMAIACGVCDGVGFGSNARAAIITRGLAEISRLSVAMGANPLTMMGLAGLGDLVLTCTGDLSRNRRVGIALGQGKTLSAILQDLGEVAEGVVTARSCRDLAHKVGVEMPITEQVYSLLYEDRPVKAALGELLGRARRAERDH